MKRSRLLGFFLVAVGFSAAALAGDGPRRIEPSQNTGTRFASNPTRVSGYERRRMFMEFVACVHRRKPNKVDYFIRHSDDRGISSEIADISSYLDLTGCIADGAIGNTNAVEGVFKVRILRGWLAELAYVKNNATLPSTPSGEMPPRAYYTLGAELIEAQGLGEFADCIVKTEPEKADVLVRTAWGSSEELAAARNLAPILGQCLPQGIELAMTAEIIRGYAASGLWQRFEGGKPLRYQGRP